MKKHQLPLTLCLILVSKLLFAQSSDVIRQYIATYKDIAIEEEVRTGVPAAITLAQGIHETQAGTSDLVRASNNHFGIKCKSEWTGQTVYHDDDAKGECFRKYDDPRDSYKDHSDFLKNRPHYASLFNLDPTDYEGWAYGLKKAGYATNPKYPQILIKLIKDYNLQDYTLIALGRKAPDQNDAVWASHKTADKDKAESLSEMRSNTAEAIHTERSAYPLGVFRINETKVTFVTKGTAYLKVAEENNIGLSRLFEFNDMDPVDIAVRDQLIYLQRKRKTGANEFHTVAEGESLYDIAQAEGMRLENLLEYNFLQPGMRPQIGEKLYLRTKAPAMPKLAVTEIPIGAMNSVANTQSIQEPDDNTEFVVHIVRPKETMYAIAKKYSVAIADVMKWNDMQTKSLRTGQTLRINKRSVNATN
jgi:LysM repeat protein